MIADLAARATAANYLHLLDEVLQNLDVEAVLRVGETLGRARCAGGTIYLAGNGGSAATASHWANDLGKATKRPGQKPMRVVSLGDHLSWLTALANDEGYQRVFSGQLENFVAPGDVLVVFSASGNSANLVAAVNTARLAGAHAIGLLGFDGGLLKSLVHDAIWVPTPKGAYGQVEDAHLIICHLITACLAGASMEAASFGSQRDACVS